MIYKLFKYAYIFKNYKQNLSIYIGFQSEIDVSFSQRLKLFEKKVIKARTTIFEYEKTVLSEN